MSAGFFYALRAAVTKISGKEPELAEWTKDHARGATKVLQKFAPIVGGINSVGKFAQGSLGLLQSALKLNKKDIEKLTSALADHRLLVLVDDIDRAHPSVVPKVFFWIHELFDLAGMSFVLAFDIDRVVPVLQAHHPGFDGRWFLEKIIDFHRWIPECSASQTLALALDEQRRHAPFLSDSVVSELADVLPASPRTIRGVFRQLRAIASEVSRHRADELDPKLLLLLELTRASWPTFFECLRTDSELVTEFIVGPAMRGRLTREEAEAAQAADLEAIAKRLAPNEHHDAARLLRILVHLRGRLMRLGDAPDLMYHAYLSERPHAVTNGEFEPFVESSRGTLSPQTLRDWIERQAERGDHSIARVTQELFVASLNLWTRSFEATSRTTSKEEQEVTMRGADDAHAVLEILWGSVAKEGGEAPALDFMTEWLGRMGRWWHFTEEVYRRRLDVAGALMTKAVQQSLCPHGSLSPLLSATQRDFPETATLHTSIQAAVEGRLAVFVRDELLLPGRVRQLGAKKESLVRGRIVVSSASPLWRAPLRQTILDFLAAMHADRQEDIVYLLRSLLEDLFPSAHVLLDDPEVRTAMWTAATRWPLNRRIRGTLGELRSKLIGRLGEGAEETMPLPSWWGAALAEPAR